MRAVARLFAVGLLFLVAVVSFAAGHGIELPYPDEWIVSHTGWTANYIEEYELPEWVAYELTADELDHDLNRTDDYREDPTVPTGSADLDDYAGSGYHRGHLVPAEDFQWSPQAMSDTFFLSNMAPQHGSFNTGLWKRLENRVREWAQDNGAVYVVAGPVLTDEIEEWIGDNQVAVPLRFYKIVVNLTEPEIKAIGFIMPNQRDDRHVREFAVSINEVEEVTGIDFFFQLEDEAEDALEETFDLSAWAW